MQHLVAEQGEPVLSGFCRRLISSDMAFAVFEPEAVAVQLEDVNVMCKAIEQRASEALGGAHAGPLIEGQVACNDDRAALVALAEALEQQLGAGRRERDGSQTVDDQKL